MLHLEMATPWPRRCDELGKLAGLSRLSFLKIPIVPEIVAVRACTSRAARAKYISTHTLISNMYHTTETLDPGDLSSVTSFKKLAPPQWIGFQVSAQ